MAKFEYAICMEYYMTVKVKAPTREAADEEVKHNYLAGKYPVLKKGRWGVTHIYDDAGEQVAEWM